MMTLFTSTHLLLLLPILTQSCSIKSGANCWKHDIPNGKQPHTMTVGECCATCTNTTLCKAFTLDIDTSQSGSDNASLGICYLKYSCGKQLYSVPLTPITHSCHCHGLTSYSRILHCLLSCQFTSKFNNATVTYLRQIYLNSTHCQFKQ